MISVGQESEDRQPLSTVLTELGKQYNHQFNYSESTIASIFLVPPNKDLSFLQVLSYLRESTGLVFTLLNNNFVSISKREGLSVCGYLMSKDKTPLVAATIQSSKNATITDENGFFELKIDNESDIVIFRYLGYRTTSKLFKDFNQTVCSEILMEPQPQSLSEIVISNYIVSGINKLNNGAFEIDFSDFNILPGLIEMDVLQSIQAFPGIQSENETVSNINIRGGTHDQNLILWDDIKMYQSGHFFGLISMYNPQITEQVSLIKNGTDVQYTDGTSGTISMKTNEHVNSDFNGNLGINFIDANGFVDVPLGKKSSIQIAGRKSISEFVQTPTYEEFFDRISQNTEVEANDSNIVNSGKTFDFYDTSLRWIYNISPKDEIRINFINVANQLVFNESAVLDAVEKSRESKVTQNSIAGGLQYNRVWNPVFRTTFHAYETDYKLQAVNANILDSQRFLQENKVSETSLKLNTFYKLNERWQLLNGYQFVETQVTNLDDVDNPLFHLLVSEVVRTHAVYSQMSFISANKLTHFNVGFRANYLDKFKKTILEPRLSFNQKFLEHFTVEVLGEFKHQNMSQVINFQNDFLGIEKRRWQLSNDSSVPVITSKQASFGIDYNHNGWLVSAVGYLKRVEGITTQSQGFQNQYEFVKTQGNYDVNGLDVLIRKKLGDFNTWFSYSLMDNMYTFSELAEQTFPSNLNIEHAVTFGLAYSTNHLKIATGLNWHTGKPTTLPVFNNEVVDGEVNFNDANSGSLDNYMRVDVSALYDFRLAKKTKGKVGVSIWNLFNNTNIINNRYTVVDEIVLIREQNSLGFTPNIVLRLFF